MDDFLITMRDLECNGMCARGVRRWFIDQGLDFKEFLKNGISSLELSGTGDGLGIKAVEMVRSRLG